MKWFSPSAIAKEISKIRWLKGKDLLTNSIQVIIFTVFFAAFFFLCSVVISFILSKVGVM